jgi:hypothetical protein
MTGNESGKIIWAKWSLREGGGVEVVATCSDAGNYVQQELSFESLAAAEAALGPSFREVVDRVTEAGFSAGRWRP